MGKNESEETPANKQDIQNANNALGINDNLSTAPTLVEVKCREGDYSATSGDSVNEKPTRKDDSPSRKIDVAMSLKVRQCDSVPAPPKVDVIPGLVSDQPKVAARQMLKGVAVDVTPAPEQLPTSYQSLKSSKVEEVQGRCEKDESVTRKPQEEQEVGEEEEEEEEGDPSLSGYPSLATDKLKEEYPDYFRMMHEQHLEIGGSEKRALSLSGRLPLTRDNKRVMDFQLYCKGLGLNKQSFHQYASRNDILAWISESGITQMRQWMGPNRHSEAEKGSSVW